MLTLFKNKTKLISLAFIAVMAFLILTPIQTFAATKIPLQFYNINFGEFDTQNTSLPVITFVISLIDGFNPCAMSILLFLISILLEMKEAWKRWYIGGVFILTSAVSYFLFLASWLKINEFIGLIPITRALIALAAWIIGLWTLNEWFKERKLAQGCKVSEQETSRKAFAKIKLLLNKNNLLLVTLGIIGLAFSVNLFELLCSAALPATYTNILAASGVNNFTKILYLLLYVFIFMLDDLLIFALAMFTLQATGITNKYNNLIKLISGVIMLILAAWISVEVLQGLDILPKF
jgi:hypothetical protein